MNCNYRRTAANPDSGEVLTCNCLLFLVVKLLKISTSNLLVINYLIINSFLELEAKHHELSSLNVTLLTVGEN